MQCRPSPAALGRRFRQLLLSRVAADRGVPVSALTVYRVDRFDLNRWGDVGALEVVYNDRGHHALYGFDALARVNCYAD